MATRNWLSGLRHIFSPSRSRKVTRRNATRSGLERLEDRIVLAAPWSEDDSYWAEAGQTLSVEFGGVLDNDYDEDYDPLEAQLVTSPAVGTLTLLPDGTLTYLAPTGYSGSVTFTYQAFDGTDTGNIATVTISVSGGSGGSNQSPTAGADSFFVETGSYGASLPVLWNDSDPDSDPLEITAVSMPQHGSASVEYDYFSWLPIVAYSPSSGYVGSDSLTSTISDGTTTSTAAALLTVHPTDNTIAQARTLSLQNDTRFTTGGLIGDGPESWSDVDIFAVSLSAGQIIRFDIDSAMIDGGGSYGSFDSLLRLFNNTGTQVAVSDDATDPDTGVASNDPYLVYNVTTTGTYYLGVSDSSNTSYDPLVSDSGWTYQTGAYLLQALREVPNHPPIAYDDTASLHFGTSTDIAVLANDSDPNANPISVSQVSSASHGTTQIVTVNGVQKIRYTPQSGYTGNDSFTYTIADPSGATATATVTVSVTNSNPQAAVDSWDFLAGVSRTIPANGVLANDTDADGDALTAVVVSGVSHGTLTLNSDGGFTYTPTAGYSGNDSFVYAASDGVGSSSSTTVTLQVYPHNVTGFADVYSTGHDTPLTVAAPGVLANDWDYEQQALTAGLIAGPAHGTLTLNANGSFVYVPAAGFVGPDSFVYRASDGVNQSDDVTVSLSVTNFAPWTVNDYYSVSHDRTLTTAAAEGVLLNDVDIEDDSLTVSLVTAPASGLLTLNANGSFIFTPATGMTGTVSFQYQADDGFSLSAVATVTIDVINAAPVSADDRFYTPADAPLTISAENLKSNDVDADGDTTTVTVASQPSHGTLTLQTSGTWVYQPNLGFAGFDTFTYTISDGLESSSPATVRLKIDNQVPLGVADFYSVRHDRALSVTTGGLLSNDEDDDGDELTVQLQMAPASGVLTLNPNGTFEFTPASGMTGTVTFRYTVTDGIDTTSPIDVTIHVTNASPIGRSDAWQLHHGQTLVTSGADGVLRNDSDADSDSLTVTLITGPAHGTLILNSDGAFTYTPATGYLGTDQFTYCITDGIVTSDPVVVTLTMTNVRPQAVAESLSVVHDRTIVKPGAAGLLSNDFDADGDALTVSVVTGASHGTLTVESSGAFIYIPATGFVGQDAFVYRVFDGAQYSDSVTVPILVTNQRPWTLDRSWSVLHDETLSVAAPGLFTSAGDGDNDVLSLLIGTQPLHGTVTISASGAFVYVPAAGYTGPDTFGYKVTDGIWESTESLVTIDVTNSAPIANGETLTVLHDRTLTLNAASGVLSNDYDGDDDLLTATVVSGHGPQHGTLTLNADGSLTYVPTATFAGVDGFRYRITDGAQTAEADVTIIVTNARPVAAVDRYGVLPGDSLVVAAAEGVLTNDSDTDQDMLQAVLVSSPAHGTLSFSSTGAFTYTPSAGFIGVDEFRYQAKDHGNLSSFTQTVYVSTTLVAVDDEFEVGHDRVLSGNLYSNDFNAYTGPFSVQVTQPPTTGSLQIGAGGTFSFTPDPGFVGQVSFTYFLQSGSNQSNPAEVTISVVNEAPLVFSGTWRTTHGRPLSTSADTGLAFRTVDRDGDALAFQIVQMPVHGTLMLDPVSGIFQYTPSTSSYVGTDTFLWKAFDGIAWSEEKTATIAIENQKASARSDSYSVHSGQGLSVNAAAGVLSSDDDADGDTLLVLVTAMPSHGTLMMASDGSFQYQPNSGVINATDTFRYRVDDGAELRGAVGLICVWNADLGGEREGD